VKEVFNVTKVGTIAGCYVRDGKIFRNSKVRIIRDGIVIHTGQLLRPQAFQGRCQGSYQRYGVRSSRFKDFSDIQAGDNIEAFEQTEVAAKL
jgi:translation initiation factor IF-2